MSRLDAMMEQVRKLRIGMGIQHLLDEAYAILGNPIAMFNTEYSLKAYTDVKTDDPIWNELIEFGTFGEITQKLFEKAGFVEEVANNRVAYLQSEHLKYDRLNGKLFSKNNTHISNLVLVACNKPLDDGDHTVFETICRLMSREIGDDTDIAIYELEHQEMVIGRLIDRKYDKLVDAAQLEILYSALEQHLYLAVVDLSQCTAVRADPTYFINLFVKIKPEFRYAAYSNNIVIILSTDGDHLDVNKELKGLIKVFEQNNLYAGISNRFENLYDLHKQYAVALNALQYVMKAGCIQRVFPCHAESIAKIEQIAALENVDGIQSLLNEAFEIFKNPVIFHDMELHLLGYTENVEIKDPVWQELLTYGVSSTETMELFRTEGFVDSMDSVMGGALLVSDKFKYDRISWRIYSSDNIRIGCTSIVNTDAPFSQDELVLFGIFSQIFTKEVAKHEVFDNYGNQYSETIINRLICGRIDDYALLTDHVGNLYNHLLENIFLVVIDTSRCKPEFANLGYYRQLFVWENAVHRFAICDNQIIIITSINDVNLVPLTESKDFEKIIHAFEQNSIYAGVSGCFKNIYELPKRYRETADVLKAGMEGTKNGGRQTVFHCDEA